MLRYKNGKWEFSPALVNYEQNGQEESNYVGSEGREWWEDLQKNKTIKNLEFIENIYDTEQAKRLDEVNKMNIGDGYSSELSQYVIDGVFPDEVGHVLSSLEIKTLKKENEILKLKSKSNTDAIEFNEDVLQDLIINTYKEVK